MEESDCCSEYYDFDTPNSLPVLFDCITRHANHLNNPALVDIDRGWLLSVVVNLLLATACRVNRTRFISFASALVLAPLPVAVREHVARRRGWFLSEGILYYQSVVQQIQTKPIWDRASSSAVSKSAGLYRDDFRHYLPRRFIFGRVFPRGWNQKARIRVRFGREHTSVYPDERFRHLTNGWYEF